MSDVVYVVTNPAMPGLVKIGYTLQEEAESRIAQLYSTGVPVPFEVAYAATVDNARLVEEALHIAFGPQRVNPKREFFRIDPEQAIAILRIMKKEDTTKQVEKQGGEIDAESLAAGEQLRKRRPNLNFLEMGIPVGGMLYYTQGESTVTVVGPKKVRLGSEELSLTAATRQISQTDYDQPPALYWTYNGRLLREIYDETYDNIE